MNSRVAKMIAISTRLDAVLDQPENKQR